MNTVEAVSVSVAAIFFAVIFAAFLYVFLPAVVSDVRSIHRQRAARKRRRQ